MRTGTVILAILAAFPACAATTGTSLDRASLDGTSLAQNYAREVRSRLTVPDAEQKAWALLLSTLLANRDLSPQYVVLVDRNSFIQAVTIYWMAPDRTFHFIGASPASTGKPGSFDHFITPQASSSTPSPIPTSAPQAPATRAASSATAAEVCGFTTSAGN